MCSCTATAACPRCRADDERDWLIEWEPGPRELEELAKYEAQRWPVTDNVGLEK